MKRTPEPCGTRAAAARHERRDEPLCAACKEAKNEYAKSLRAVRKPARQISMNKEQLAMDAALAEMPPVIFWRKNNHGVLVHTFIDDPHADSGYKKEAV